MAGAKALDDTTRAAVAGLLARLADNKYYLGRLYAEWCSGAPTLESAVAAAAMAQDELGHARAMYPLLRTLMPDAGPEIDPETRTQFTNMRFLDTPFSGWEDFVTANFLIDRALTLIFEAAQTSSYEPLAARSRKVLQEEKTHTLHGDAWVRRLARSGQAARIAMETSLRRAWVETLCWFGPAGISDTLADSGVLDGTPDELRRRFLGVVGPIIETEGLHLPLQRAQDGDGWELTEQLPWEQWDRASYRLSATEASRSSATTRSSNTAD